MHNILDKTDKSMATTFGDARKSVKKDAKYNWCPGGTAGEFRMIRKDMLNIDGRYQRDAVSENKVRNIAANWDWLLFGCLSVVQRDDNEFVVFDGGHRTRAAFYKADIIELPCMVHLVNSVNDEAKAFVARNTMISAVSAIARHHASVFAGEPVSLQVNDLLQKYGLSIHGTPTSESQLKCIKVITRSVESDAVMADRCLKFLMPMLHGSRLIGAVYAGLFCLCKRFEQKNVDILKEYGYKLSRFSIREIEIAQRQFKAETGKGGETSGAKAIMGIINKGLRYRLEW